MAERPAEYEMVRCWVEGRAWWHEEQGADPKRARVLAWGAWFALSPAQQALELAVVPAEHPGRPCYRVVDRKN